MHHQGRFAVVALSVTSTLALTISTSTASTAIGVASRHSTSVIPTLTVEASPSGPITRDFNPFSGSSSDNILGATSLIYEPLLQYDEAQPSKIYPWLATSYTWSNDGKKITLHLRSNVNWSNGTPFTGSDVAFTFQLLKKYPALNTGGLPIVSSSAPTPRTAVINFSSPSYVLLYYIASVLIVPASQWRAVSNPATYSDPNPIGTGPYMLSSYSPEGLALTKNPRYWQKGEPVVSKIDFPVYDSNTSANIALEQGSLDWAGNFVPNIKSAYVDRNPSTNRYWFTPNEVYGLFPNLKDFPFNVLAVRQALEAGINGTVIANEGEDDELGLPMTGPGTLTGLVLPTDSAYLTGAMSKYEANFDPAKAKAILVRAGWKMGSNGIFVSPSGKPLAFTIEDPSAFTDFMTDAQIMQSELRKVGMDVSVVGTSVNKWSSDTADGTFQATVSWSAWGPSPYYEYNYVMNSDLSAPIGKSAADDFERFDSAQADALLKSYSSTNDPVTQKAAIAGLEHIFATELPMIPLWYGTSGGEYHTNQFVGWPSAANPYESAGPDLPYDEVTVLRLRPAH
jgi:peptide/nickel transport system substrate-binding protein